MSTLKSEFGGDSSKSYGSYSFVHDDKLGKGDSSGLDSVLDSECWLNNRGLGGVSSNDQLNMLDAEAKVFGASDVHKYAKTDTESQLIEEYYTFYTKKSPALCSDVPVKHSHSHCKNDQDSWLQEFESTIDYDLISTAHLMDLDNSSCLILERPKKICSDMDSHWIGLKKMEPWWHAADKDDLPYLVSQRPYHSTRNCALPGLQSMHAEKVSNDRATCFDKVEKQFSDKETKVSHVSDCSEGNLASVKDVEVSYRDDSSRGNIASLNVNNSQGKRGLIECISEEQNGTLRNDSICATKVDSSNATEPTTADLSRAQLLEALCHSQTRAREAEKLAQEACAEKDHIVDLFFKQASCLFAYRQWLRILQLETLCCYLRSNRQLHSLTIPAFSPLFHSRGVVLRKNCLRAAPKKSGKQKCSISRCAVAFAVGLSFAGAGLLVGWAIGMAFPCILVCQRCA